MKSYKMTQEYFSIDVKILLKKHLSFFLIRKNKHDITRSLESVER